MGNYTVVYFREAFVKTFQNNITQKAGICPVWSSLISAIVGRVTWYRAEITNVTSLFELIF